MLDNKVYIVFLAEILKMRAKFYTTQGDDATKIRPDWNATNDTSTCFFFFFSSESHRILVAWRRKLCRSEFSCRGILRAIG